MIRLSRLNEKELVVNNDLIVFVESTPDTVITLTSGQKIVVKETVEEVIEKVMLYKARVYRYEREFEENEGV